ncbi:threonine-phosphate decarboxylase CobD [Pelotalea chapellei]|uniref:threonine-phosphate decarboxylase n=1 Tax=Pelotalea chapellei TaxID=44671 RepID=A0ABS5U9X6_9BACT|nr:threonine-phosphate decarboxylase CobD [Pelotalea chapellei]MBT1072463.1 threonine-phosphate decarboxylase [Pelotalea chapellei]
MSSNNEHGGNIFAVSRQLGLSPGETIDFSASINPLGLSAVVREAIISALDSLIHYPDTSCEELKRALADDHALPAEHFLVANGSTELIYNLPAMLAGRRALIVSPSFSEYAYALEQHNWEISHFILSPKDSFRLDPEKLRDVLGNGYDALYLCNPANPSGIVFPRHLIEQVCDICRDSGTFLVLDEAFIDFCPGATAAPTIAACSNGLVLRSMTKFFAIPGLRLGYAVASPDVIEKLGRVSSPWSVNTLAQAAGVAALGDHKYQSMSLEYLNSQRSWLTEQLSRFRQLTVYPSSANFLLVEISSGCTSTELQGLLLKEHILIRDCSSFVGLSDRFFRIAIRTAEENRRLVECLTILTNENSL